MDTFQIERILIPILAAFVVVLCLWRLRKLYVLQKSFRHSIVLIPLYKGRNTLFVGVVFFGISNIICAYYMILTGSVLVYLYLIIIFTSCLATCVGMLMSRHAVTDSGIVIPYRFIEWHNLYDYYIDGRTVIFSGNVKGQITLLSTTLPMRFNQDDLKKLEYILNKNKVKHKTNI